MNKVVHFEIAVANLERAKKFYTTIFDWKIFSWEKENPDYYLIQTAETDDRGMLKEPGSINGGMYIRQSEIASGAENAFVCTVQVEDIVQSLKKVQECGGEVIMQKKEIPTIGFSARCKDLDGNVFGLLQPRKR